MVPVWSNSPGETWSQEHYDFIAAKGFNSVRFVLYWDDFEALPGVFDQRSLDTLDTAVGRAKAAGLYVVLNMVHLSGERGLDAVPGWAVSGDSVATLQANAHEYLAMLAERYRGEPAVAAYDPVNEPRRWPIDQNAVLRMYDDLITTIRGRDPSKIVMVEPTYGDSSIMPGCADFANLKQRTNVIFSLHYYYAGGDDDGFGPDCGRVGRDASDGKAGYEEIDADSLRRHLEVYVDTLAAEGIPLHLGEFGMGEGAVNRDQWISDLTQLLAEHELSSAWWEYRTMANETRFSATDPDGGWRRFVDLLVTHPSSSSPGPVPSGSPEAVPVRTGDPVVMAVGDFTPCQGAEACARSHTAKVKDLIGARNPDAILGIGDFQYQYIDTIDEGFNLIFGPKPGGLWSKVYPTAGGYHDVRDCAGRRYQDYWGRSAMKGYSFDIGEWHIISLPAAAYRLDCDPDGVTEWLGKDLDASRKRCTLAFWQDPYWSRPTARHERELKLRPWVEILYTHGVELVLQASNHNYQRFAPQDPDDQKDVIRGIRAFVVGTGGVSHYEFTGRARHVEASDATTFGALELTLRPDRYDWRFEPAAGGDFTDTGSDRCH